MFVYDVLTACTRRARISLENARSATYVMGVIPPSSRTFGTSGTPLHPDSSTIVLSSRWIAIAITPQRSD